LGRRPGIRLPVGRRIQELRSIINTLTRSFVKVKPMRKHTVRAITGSLSTAVAVLLFVVGSSAAVADAGSGHRGGRSSMSSGRHVGHSDGRMGRAVRGARVRGGRHSVRHDRGGRRYGWFNRDRRHYERSFISFGGGSFRRGYRSSGALFFGFSFSASEYRRSSGLGYRRDVRREYRSDVAAPRANDSSVQRAAIEHPASQSGPLSVPLVASPAAPELLPMKD
jgi:hypothetical protein